MLRAWVLVIVGVAGLVSLRVAYDLTYEPAPWVRIRWRDGTGDWRRAWLEREYRLGDPSNPEGLSYSYVLYDTSRTNIEAMVTDPEVADTNDIDRRKFEVPWETEQESQRWMWVADRTPGLRRPEVRWLAAAALAAMTLLGLTRIFQSEDWGRRRRAMVEWLRRLDAMLRHG